MFYLINSEDLDICPFCKKSIPQGPAYFCPTCGKRLGDEYSNRKIIFEDTDNLMDRTMDDSSIDELDDITSLIKSNSSYSDDFISDSEEDVSVDNLSGIAETNSDLEDQESISIETEELEEILEEPIEEQSLVEEEDSLDEETEEQGLVLEEDSLEEDSEDIGSRVLTLKSQNKSIKLDLFLKYCVDEEFLYNFLRYRIVDADGDKDTLIDRIIFGYVIDFIGFNIFSYSFPIFNIADIFIVLGAIFIIFEKDKK